MFRGILGSVTRHLVASVLGGGVMAMVVGLTGMILGGLALARSRPIA